MSLTTRLDAWLYPSYDDQWTSRLYRDFVRRHLRPTDALLDYGAGRGKEALHGFRGHAFRIVGVDVDEAVLSNPTLDEAHVIDPYGRIPYPDDTFDVVTSAYVLEHIAEPERVFAEIRRVLKPGGVFLFMTPNRRHYVPVIASLTPHWFHLWVNGRRGLADHDTFPTVYRSNTESAIRALAREANLNVSELVLIEGRPEYLRTFPPLYLIGAMYERAVNSVGALSSLRVLMLGALRKPKSG